MVCAKMHAGKERRVGKLVLATRNDGHVRLHAVMNTGDLHLLCATLSSLKNRSDTQWNSSETNAHARAHTAPLLLRSDERPCRWQLLHSSRPFLAVRRLGRAAAAAVESEEMSCQPLATVLDRACSRRRLEVDIHQTKTRAEALAPLKAGAQVSRSSDAAA